MHAIFGIGKYDVKIIRRFVLKWFIFWGHTF